MTRLIVCSRVPWWPIVECLVGQRLPDLRTVVLGLTSENSAKGHFVYQSFEMSIGSPSNITLISHSPLAAWNMQDRALCRELLLNALQPSPRF